MNTIIIACRTLEKEITKAMQETACSYEIRWFEQGLHNTPKKLKQTLQKMFDEALGVDRVLMGMGFCGNSIEGLHTRDLEVIFPRVDDCISLLLGSVKERIRLNHELAVIFLTEGWVKGERNIYQEYQDIMEKYGEATGKSIFEMLIGNYRRLAMLDTGYYDMRVVGKIGREYAKTLGLEYVEVSGTINYLNKLLTGPWEETEFLVLKPGHTIGISNLLM